MISGGTHRFTIRVYYEDTDAGGVVYYANYLRFAERARTEALREMGVSHAGMTALHGCFFMVRRVKLDYLAPAHLDDCLTVTTRTTAVGGASVGLRQDFLIMRPEGAPRRIAEAELQLACVRVADGRPVAIPSRWRQALVAFAGSGIEES